MRFPMKSTFIRSLQSLLPLSVIVHIEILYIKVITSCDVVNALQTESEKIWSK